MSDARLLPPALLVVLALVLTVLLVSRGDAPGAAPIDGELEGARYRPAATGSAMPALPAPAPLRFASGVAAGDQQVVRDAVAAARPEARRLVELVSGLVTVSVGSPAHGVAGEMRATPAGYDVQLDLGPVYAANGLRGVRRVVLHELAHVVDHALVPTAMERDLDAATPPGFGCDDDGRSGGCAAREERFAESFAKWATGDIGVDVYLGYRVPPPTSLESWGAPLAALLREP
ncbi:MAG TPA: hypothetical protein VMY78_18895 [Solirubrobacteraceae bacterium]|nr:hypothetical protein [Solirubrobacteraceae bacterium]